MFALSFVTTLAARLQSQAHPGNVAAVQGELRALVADFHSGKLRHRCGLHKRLYTFVRQYDQDYLFEGMYSKLVAQGLPKERAEFFLDPWNSPYWVQCTKKGRKRFEYVYSFGPNRRRESTEWEILGERNRAALNQNFARELPLEYRATLKNYYERVAK